MNADILTTEPWGFPYHADCLRQRNEQMQRSHGYIHRIKEVIRFRGPGWDTVRGCECTACHQRFIYPLQSPHPANAQR